MPKTKIRGPKDGALTTATFVGKAKLGLAPETLANSTVLVLLSIRGNEQCTGNFLEATLEHAVATHGQTIALVADEIHWHNLKGFDVNATQEMELRQQANHLGSDYIKQNLAHFLAILEKRISGCAAVFCAQHSQASISEQVAAFNALADQHAVPLKIMRWADWVTPAFSTQQSAMSALYETEETLREATAITAADFARRHKNHPPIEDDTMISGCASPEIVEQLWLHRSRGYLAEEGPGIFWLAAQEHGIRFIAYPGAITESLEAARTFFIKSSNDLDAHPLSARVQNTTDAAMWLQINFRRERINPPVDHSAENTSTRITATNEVRRKHIASRELSPSPKPRVHYSRNPFLVFACKESPVDALVEKFQTLAHAQQVKVIATIVRDLNGPLVSELRALLDSKCSTPSAAMDYLSTEGELIYPEEAPRTVTCPGRSGPR